MYINGVTAMFGRTPNLRRFVVFLLAVPVHEVLSDGADECFFVRGFEMACRHGTTRERNNEASSLGQELVVLVYGSRNLGKSRRCDIFVDLDVSKDQAP